jgi:hypothetical protein
MATTASAVSEISFPCRLLGHMWQLYTPENRQRHALYLQCQRCTMKRDDVFDGRGALVTRRYNAPEGYYLARDQERPAVEELRVWAMRRQNRLVGQSRLDT